MSKNRTSLFYAGNRCSKHRNRNIDWNFYANHFSGNKLGIINTSSNKLNAFVAYH